MTQHLPSVIDQLASSLGRNDEAPNIDLANRIAASKDPAAVVELIAALDDPSQSLRSDALKVLYETGKIEPALIAEHGERFVRLLGDRHNRMVWGSMEALAAVASVKPASLLPHLQTIMQATTHGSVITRDWGVRVLTSLAMADNGARLAISKFLMNLLETSKPSEFPRHAESMQPLLATYDQLAADFRAVAVVRLPELTGPQAKRTERILATLA